MENYQVLIDGLKEAYEKAGWLGLAAAALMLGVRLYRLDLVQGFLPEKMRWENLGLWPQRSVVFGSAFVAGVLAAVLGGLSWTAAALAAVPVALGAMLAHKLSKVAGSSLNGVLVKIPLYDGSGIQKAVAVVLPPGKPKAQP